MSENDKTSPSAGAKPRWRGMGINDQPKWVWEAVAFNLSMFRCQDDETLAVDEIKLEIARVRRMYSSPRSQSPLQAARFAREAQ